MTNPSRSSLTAEVRLREGRGKQLHIDTNVLEQLTLCTNMVDTFTISICEPIVT